MLKSAFWCVACCIAGNQIYTRVVQSENALKFKFVCVIEFLRPCWILAGKAMCIDLVLFQETSCLIAILNYQTDMMWKFCHRAKSRFKMFKISAYASTPQWYKWKLSSEHARSEDHPIKNLSGAQNAPVQSIKMYGKLLNKWWRQFKYFVSENSRKGAKNIATWSNFVVPHLTYFQEESC